MTTVLITGGFGYVGSRLTPHLLECGCGVRVIDLCLYGRWGLQALEQRPEYPRWKERFSFVEGDIRDPAAVSEAVTNVDAIIHLAAISNDPTGQIDEVLTRQVNFDAVGMLLAIAKERGVGRFINASSSSVFGKRSESSITEELEPEPLTYYSRYKMLSEWLVRSAAAKDFVAVNVRPATICGYSPRQRFDLTVNKLTADAIRTGVITVHGGEQRRPNVGMNDVIKFYRDLLICDASQINGQTFNFGFENLKVIEIAQLIQKELADRAVRIEVAPVVDERDYHITSSKVQDRLDFEPVSSIRREVAELRRALEESNEFGSIAEDRYYNMKSMRLERHPGAYHFLAQ